MMVRPQANVLASNYHNLQKKRSDWLTPWRVTMFAPSRGINKNVNNKLTNELIYLLPPPPRHRRSSVVTMTIVAKMATMLMLTH